MKVIAFYLPQYHTFPENDKWWGKGFTEWTNTKKATPLFTGHYQPHKPINNNYYDLTDQHTLYNQAKLAKKYGIYGFCFYHYWFENGKLLMEKPVERFLHDKKIDINFCLSWANEPWTRAWDGVSKEIIMPQEYGNKKEWKEHFNYFLQYFKDERYIREAGKPILIIYKPEIIPCLTDMLNYWEELAIENGLTGLFLIAQGANYCSKQYFSHYNDIFDAYIMYEPGFSYNLILSADAWKEYAKKPKLFFQNFLSCWKYLVRKLAIKSLSIFNFKILDKCDVHIIWKQILNRQKKDKFYPGAFATWDNSARRGRDARITVDFNADDYKLFMSNLGKKYKDAQYLFFTAWNEWAEGSHLEPDVKYGYSYLEGVEKFSDKN